MVGPARKPVIGIVILVVVVALGVIQLTRSTGRPVATIAPTVQLGFKGVEPSLPWPSRGTAALSIGGVGLVGSTGDNNELPIWSVAKLMTAYVVFEDHPLRSGSGGPSINVTPSDVSVYNSDIAQKESVVAVQAGEAMSERTALEAMLVPSGNNIAEMLGNWDAGNIGTFARKMNATARALNMNHTHYTDASGVDPNTVSTAADQMIIFKKAWAIAALRHIMEMPSVNLPVAGTQYNYAYLIGHDGFLGGKTGSSGTSPADVTGSFAFAAQKVVAGRSRLIMGVIVGEPTATTYPLPMPPQANDPQSPVDVAEADAYNLVNAVSGYHLGTAGVPAGTVLGHVSAPWISNDPAVTEIAVDFTGFPGMKVSTSVVRRPLGTTVVANQVIGSITITAGYQVKTVNIVVLRGVPPPSFGWKLTRL